MMDVHQLEYPRLADYDLSNPDTESNAKHLRHAIKNRLNSLGLVAEALRVELLAGRTPDRGEVDAFLASIKVTVQEAVRIIDGVRELPPQPPHSSKRVG